MPVRPRRYRAYMRMLAIVVGLSLTLQGCGGGIPAGDIYVCDENGNCQVLPATPAPPAPTPQGCVDPQNIRFLYPLSYPAVGTTMYFAAKPGVVVSSALAMELVYFTSSGPNSDGPTHTEVGNTVINVTGNVPPYILPLPAGYTTVYESQNLPLPYNVIVSVNVVDTRTPAICALAGIAGFNTEPPDD